MDKPDQQEIDELEAEALVRIEEDNKDPRLQTYFKRLDTNTIVRTSGEYDYCEKNKIPMGWVTYTQAIALLHQQDAANRARIKKKQKRKSAKMARKKNRHG